MMTNIYLCIVVLMNVFLSWGAVKAPQAETNLIRGPHIQNVTPTSAVISWTTSGPGPAAVDFGTSANDSRYVNAVTRTIEGAAEDSASGRYQHTAELAGLRPRTRYWYRILTGNADITPWPTATFTTATTGNSFTFAAFGDSRSASAAAKALAKKMAGYSLDLAILVGDIANRGLEAEYDSQYFGVFRDLIGRVPVYTITGNHDLASRTVQPYLDAFHLPENGPAKLAERAYSFDWGNAHFVGLDSHLPVGPGSAQYDWLVADLAATKKQWKFVYVHHPPYSSGNHGGKRTIREALTPIFEKYGVDVVFSGHDHSYERTVPMAGGKAVADGSRGVTYIVTGGGGSGLYKVGKSPFTAASRSVHHFVRLRVDGCTLHAEAIDVKGQVFDTFAIDKCDA